MTKPKNQSPKRKRTPSDVKSRTSWEPVADWYARYIDSQASAYQREIIFPGALRLLEPKADKRYLDIACGQGAFTHFIAVKNHVQVTGIDASESLIREAKKRALRTETFFVTDAAHFSSYVPRESFDGAVCLMAIQNIEHIGAVFHEASLVLKKDATFVLVMNHPCFRQPSQSGWGWDEKRKLQYRRVDRYLSAYDAPILAHPGSDRSIKTVSFHRPLGAYVNSLSRNGFTIDALEEWTSNKKSDSGPRAKAENFARQEIPLFLALRARKQNKE
ncbi:MAG TPA: class I SAM-dependent methyltransferase [Patescibacteria group bacterium]|nr:class I SAM-dependent methyltransferase [Patescibacteria group bacterium]